VATGSKGRRKREEEEEEREEREEKEEKEVGSGPQKPESHAWDCPQSPRQFPTLTLAFVAAAAIFPR